MAAPAECGRSGVRTRTLAAADLPDARHRGARPGQDRQGFARPKRVATAPRGGRGGRSLGAGEGRGGPARGPRGGGDRGQAAEGGGEPGEASPRGGESEWERAG